MTIKKKIYHWITRQRRKSFGKLLYSMNSVIYEALENKNNDFSTNGEQWLIESLDSDFPLTIFDVGANVGEWTMLVQQKNKNARIHSFEPIPEIFEKLLDNTKKFKLIRKNNLALGEFSGFFEMNYYPQNPLFSSFYSHPLGKNKENIIKVEVMTGDMYCLLNNIEFIDFLKIDVEGFESNVLNGFERMFSEKRIKMVQFEYGDLVLKSNFFLRDFFAYFNSKGFSVGKLFPNYIDFQNYKPKMENFLTSNYIAILNS